MNRHVKITLSVYPHSRGFGFVVVEGPGMLVDYRICTVKPASNERVLARFKKIMALHNPTMVLLREAEASLSDKRQRIPKLIAVLNKFLKSKDIPVYRYSREQVKNAFDQFGATTKYDIAHRIAGEYKELKERAPKPRKAWMEEDYNMPIFDALALVGTHNFLTE